MGLEPFLATNHTWASFQPSRRYPCHKMFEKEDWEFGHHGWWHQNPRPLHWSPLPKAVLESWRKYYFKKGPNKAKSQYTYNVCILTPNPQNNLRSCCKPSSSSRLNLHLVGPWHFSTWARYLEPISAYTILNRWTKSARDLSKIKTFPAIN